MENATITEPTPKEKIAAIMTDLGLSITSEFVPFSKSRNAKPGDDGKVWRSLNWRVTLERIGRAILTTDYSSGEGHCPASKLSVKAGGNPNSIMRREMLDYEIEKGRPYMQNRFGQTGPATIQPDACDVLASLVMDSSVLDCGGFEEWADDCGYDTDSRKAEATYRACLEIALKLRSGLGEAGLQQLRDACQDY